MFKCLKTQELTFNCQNDINIVVQPQFISIFTRIWPQQEQIIIYYDYNIIKRLNLSFLHSFPTRQRDRSWQSIHRSYNNA